VSPSGQDGRRAPSSGHTARYRPGAVPASADGRLHSDVFARNAPPLIAALAPFLGGRTGAVLEIGCGTGQHAAAFALAFPGLCWVPSDPDPIHRASAAAWAAHLRAPPHPPLDIDAAAAWPDQPQVAALGPLSGVFAGNVTHIAPFAVTEGLIAGAGQRLARGGLLMIYGPFIQAGRMIGAGNAAFDERLRAENPAWGLRDTDRITELAAAAGLEEAALIAMPANNRLLIHRKPPAA